MSNNRFLLRHGVVNRELVINKESISFAIYAIFVYGLMTSIFPVMLRYDNGWILLVAYTWANDLGFDNAWVNPISSGIFNWHGFLQPAVISWLMPGKGFMALNIAVVLLGLFYLTAWSFVVNLMIRSRSYRYVLYVIGVSSALHFSARPELLASLWSMLIVLVLFFSGSRSFSLRTRVGLAGGLVALTAVTSPAAGVLAALGAAAAVTSLRAKESVGAIVLDGIVAMAVGALTGALMLWFVYPHEPITWLAGIREHMGVNASRTDVDSFLKYYAVTPLFPMLLIPLFLLAVILAQQSIRIKFLINKIMFIVIALILVYFVYYVAVRISATYYNFAFAVPVICLASAALMDRKALAVKQEWPLKHLVSVPLFLFAAACLLSQMVWVVQKTASGLTYATMEREISERVDQYLAEGRTIGMDPPLAAAVDDIEKLRKIVLLFFGVNKDLHAPPTVDVIFRAQTELGEMYDDVPGFELVHDRQSRSILSSVMKPLSLHYVIYEREEIRAAEIGPDANGDAVAGEQVSTRAGI